MLQCQFKLDVYEMILKEHPPISINPEELQLTRDEASELAEELKRQLRDGKRLKADQENIQLLVAGLGDSRGLLRRTFSESLGVIGAAALPALRVALLTSSNVTVRRAAAKTLKLVGDSNALPDLLSALINDPDPVVQGSAAGAMAIFGEEAAELLIKVLENEESTAMQSGLARWGLAFVGAEAPEAIRKAAQSKHLEVRAAAIAALGDQIQSLNDKKAKALLLKALDDPSPEVRAEATTLLGKLTDPNLSKDLLGSKLSDLNPQVRKSAAFSLMKSKSTQALPELKRRELLETDHDTAVVMKLAIEQLSRLERIE